jgi:hypothetical protein
MRIRTMLVLVPAAVVAAACGRSGNQSADDALKNDLALASQAQPYMPQQFVSPTEAGLGAQPGANPYMQPLTRQPVATRPVSTRRTTTRRSSSSAGTIYRAPAEPQTRVVKNTNRDAAIGAAAGAVIGATTSRDKVKGGLIGAAAGGIIGAIIGNNVDVKRVPF